MRLTIPGFILGLLLWAVPATAQETLRYDLSQSPLEYRVEIVQDMSVPLPAGKSSQVRTDIKAKMVWTVEAERQGGARVLKLAFSEFATTLTTGDKPAASHEHLESLAPFELIVVLTERGEVQDLVFDSSNPARLRALSLFNDMVVRALPVLPKDAVGTGATWRDTDAKNVESGGTRVSGKLDRKFRLEGTGVVGFSNVGSLETSAEIDDVDIKRVTQIVSEGSARFKAGVLVELSATTEGKTAKTKEFGAAKVRTTVRLRRAP